MDTLEPKSPNSAFNQTPKLPIFVTLDPSQYFLYQTSQLNIHAPDGRHLLTVGKGISTEETENRVFRLREQVCLVSCLLANINDTVNLPVPAVLGLADLFCRIKEG